MSHQYSIPEIWEKYFGGGDSLKWDDFRQKLKKIHVAPDSQRGFKRFLATKEGSELVVTKAVFLDKLKTFPKISVSTYQGGDLSGGIPSFVFVAKSFSLPGFIPTKDPQEKNLQNGQYVIRFTSSDKFIFSAETKDASGKITKLGIAVVDDKLCVTKDEKDNNLHDLTKNGKSFKGLKPMPYKDLFLDDEEQKLYDHIKTEVGGNEEKAKEVFDQATLGGFDTVKSYEDEKGN